MAELSLSNSDETVNVNRRALLNLDVVLKKTSSLAELLFACNILEFDKGNPTHQYIWTLVDNVIVAEELLHALIENDEQMEYVPIPDAYKRLDSMLSTARQMQELMRTHLQFKETIAVLKQQLVHMQSTVQGE